MGQNTGRRAFLIAVLAVVLIFGFTSGFLLEFMRQDSQLSDGAGNTVYLVSSGQFKITNSQQIQVAEVLISSDGQAVIINGAGQEALTVSVSSSGQAQVKAALTP